MVPVFWYIAPIGAVFALFFSYILFKGMKKEPAGNEQMVKIAQYVREGAFAYLRQQYRGVIIFFIFAFIIFNIIQTH